jgi:release factor glutamine methyltransferase
VTDVNADLVGELVATGIDRREARWLVEEFAPMSDTAGVSALRLAAQRRRNGEPLQYVIGHWPFRSLDLEVDERVLIPRPETEELVGVALEELSRNGAVAPLIVDLGCGSGAIGLALVDELRARGVSALLVAVDESLDALAVAQQNALRNDVKGVTFVHSTWFEGLDESLRGRIDLIVANPPYVGAGEFTDLDPVLRHEPHGAIVAPDAKGTVGFADLDVIIADATKWLTSDGVLVCEHANTQRDAVLSAASAAGFTHVSDLDDLAGHPRVLVARR